MRNQQEIKKSWPPATNFLSLLMCVKSDAGEMREHAPRPLNEIYNCGLSTPDIEHDNKINRD